jgi:hypothetical protein
MSTSQDNEDMTQTGNSEKSPRTQVEKLRLELKAASARARAEEKARLKLEEALAQAQADAQDAQADAERERQMRLQAEQALSDVQKKPIAGPAIPAGSGAESRLVFILRLSLDENRQPKRVEIEENQTRKRDSIPGLDYRRISAFIQTFLSPLSLGEEQPAAQAPGPMKIAGEIERTPTIVITDVEVGDSQDPFNRLVFYPHDRVQVRIRFHLDNPDILPEVDRDEGFEIKLHARNRQDNTYQLVASQRQAVLPGLVQYSVELELRNLLPGLYSLFTVVSLPSARLGRFFEGPVFEVPTLQTKDEAWSEARREELTSSS